MKALKVVALALFALALMAAPALAQDTKSAPGSTYVISGAGIGVGIGVALAIIGAGYGFGRIGSAALEGMARQPEVAGKIQVAALIIGALLEGATFFGLIVCNSMLDKVTF